MMLDFTGKSVYLACGATHMSAGIDALAAVVQGSFNLNAASGAIFVFCNSNRDRLKILEWDGDGFWLHYKRLEHGRFPWPQQSGDEKTMSLSVRELEHLLGGSKLKMRFDRIDYSSHSVV